jgi:hypothetical protein
MPFIEEDTVEPDNEALNYVKSKLTTNYISLEGYSTSDLQLRFLLDRYIIKADTTEENLRKELLNSFKFQVYTILSKITGRSVIVLLYKEDFSRFVLYDIDSEKIKLICDIKSLDELIEHLKIVIPLKRRSITKDFREKGYLKDIDKIFRDKEHPWPPNIDLLILNKSLEPKVILEFTKTNKTNIIEHELRKYYKEDVNRWKAIKALSDTIKTPVKIVIWAEESNLKKWGIKGHSVKVTTVNEIIDNSNNRNQIYNIMDIEDFVKTINQGD